MADLRLVMRNSKLRAFILNIYICRK